MSLLVLGLGAVAAVVLAVAASGVPRSAGAVADLPPRVRRASRTVTTCRGAGTVAGTAVAAWALQEDSLGRGLLLAAPLLAFCALVGVVVGELLVTSPTGPVREAGLTVRRWRDYLPPRLATAVGVAAGLLAAILVATSLAGSADDLGRPGRVLARRCSAVSSEAHGPWPGSFYSWPLAVVLAVGLGLAGMALLRIARRPSQGEDPAVEDALRRRAAAAVTAAAGLLVAVPLFGVSAMAAGGLLGIGCRPAVWTLLGAGLLALLPLAVALAARCLVVLAVPALGEPRPAAGRAGR